MNAPFILARQIDDFGAITAFGVDPNMIISFQFDNSEGEAVLQLTLDYYNNGEDGAVTEKVYKGQLATDLFEQLEMLSLHEQISATQQAKEAMLNLKAQLQQDMKSEGERWQTNR